jgi:hypothetical protein
MTTDPTGKQREVSKDEEVKTHPVQRNSIPARFGARCPVVVTIAAYEVYCEVFGEQAVLVTGDCRGGFGMGELIAFLYAKSFPRNEWRKRVDEALRGMENI